MKYTQSGGGYYFKVYKNGKKKRISEKEYKQRGGYRKPDMEMIINVIDQKNLHNLDYERVYFGGQTASLRNLLKIRCMDNKKEEVDKYIIIYQDTTFGPLKYMEILKDEVFLYQINKYIKKCTKIENYKINTIEGINNHNKEVIFSFYDDKLKNNKKHPHNFHYSFIKFDETTLKLIKERNSLESEHKIKPENIMTTLLKYNKFIVPSQNSNFNISLPLFKINS